MKRDDFIDDWPAEGILRVNRAIFTDQAGQGQARDQRGGLGMKGRTKKRCNVPIPTEAPRSRGRAFIPIQSMLAFSADRQRASPNAHA